MVGMVRLGLLVIGMVARFLDLNLIQSCRQSILCLDTDTIRQIMGEHSRRGLA